MSKIVKLINDPALFIQDFAEKRINSLLNKQDKHKFISQDLVSETKKSEVDAKKKAEADAKKKAEADAKKKAEADAKKKAEADAKKQEEVYNSIEILSSINFINPNYKFDGKSYVYLPWIKSHGDALINKINISNQYTIHPLNIVENMTDKQRSLISKYSRQYPELYRKVLIRHLVVLKNKIQGVIVTFDWHPVMRILVDVCKDLDIPTILILHESVFLNEDKYYSYTSGDYTINIPKSDYVIAWGNLHRNIFVKRGLDADKIRILGAPKFDIYHNYKKLLTREQFCLVYGLNPSKKIILYALQPMDSQVDQKVAIRAQNQAVIDVMDFCDKFDYQLILREPPSQSVNTIFRKQRDRVEYTENFIIDTSGEYLVPAEECLYHTDLVLSINSTMLFEALLLNTPVISTKYINFEQIWDNIGIPVAKTKRELFEKIEKTLEVGYVPDLEKWRWSEENLSIGKFDGQSTHRIVNFLEEFGIESHDHKELFLEKKIYVANSNPRILETTAQYLPEMLNLSDLVKPKNHIEASYCDAVIQWGITESNNKKAVEQLMKPFGKRPFIIEDGFIRSIGIGLSKEPGLSLALCGETAYYDAYGISNFERELNSNRVFSDDELLLASIAIENITKNNISKYNDSPILPIQVGRPNKKKVLVVDQRYGDQSVISGKADANSFKQMLIDAISDNPDSDIIVKRHPDAIKGGKGSYFDAERIDFINELNKREDVFIIDFDIHPHQLIKDCEKVYVCTSGLGFEALFYGKQVICYGVPFYAGWGITLDKVSEHTRVKKRTLEEVFYISYIEYSRYYSPSLNRVCDINECIDYIIEHRAL